MFTAFQVSFVAGWVFLVLALCAVGFIALIVGALWVYGDAQSRRMDATLWVLLLILGTLFGAGIVGFVIVLVIYLVVRESHPVGGGVPYGYGYMPPGYGPAPPPQQGPPMPPSAPTAPAQVIPAACPVCGRPMMWVPQYGRWYCPTCGQYR
jgi:hypothetical protein